MNPRYDVFLSHSSADKPAVEELARKLQDAKIEPFLDKWHLIPGDPWQEALEEALDASRTCAVFLGPKGFGSWQNEEMRSALETRAGNRSFRVIPVLLPGSFEPRKEELPRFLRRLTWADFRGGLEDKDAFHRLVSGIQGKAPGPGRGEPAKRPLPYRCMAQPPDEWVHRREYDEILEALCPKDGLQAGRSVGITTALKGAGGFGKTALAQKLCFDERVREAYPDGILWVTMGEDLTEAGRLARIRDLIRGWTEKEAPAFETVDGAGTALRNLLAGLKVLLVIDDAWSSLDVNPLKGLDSGSALLITTRVAHVLPEKSIFFPVDSLASSEAVALLGLGLPSNALASGEIKELAARLGEWALLLRLVNGTLKDLVKRGLSVQEAIQRANEDLDAEGFSAFDQNDPDSRHAAAARALLVSVKYLSEVDRNLFFELAIFPEDEDIPLSVLSRYWGLNSSRTRKLFGKLNDLSLLRELDPKEESIRLHDVTLKILQEQRAEALSGLHDRLLDACRPKSGQWEDLPVGESYLWRRLRDHFTGAERQPEFKALLGSFSFIEAKLMATDVNSLIADYETFVAESPELRLIRDALRLSAHILGKDRAQVSSQLIGRLLGFHEPVLRTLVEAARSRHQGIGLWPRAASLVQAGGDLIRTLEGHTARVTAVAVVDGRRAVSASNDETLRVWDLERGQTLKTLEGHAGVTAVAVLDGRRAVSAYYDRTLWVRDLESGQILKTLEGHTDWVNAVAVVDGRRAVSASDDGTLLVWDLESGQTLQTLEGHTDEVRAVAVVDGRRAVSASDDRTLLVWDLESGQEIAVMTLDAPVGAVASTPAGNIVVTGAQSGKVHFFDLVEPE
jgi:WD40 repeat protein